MGIFHKSQVSRESVRLLAMDARWHEKSRPSHRSVCVWNWGGGAQREIETVRATERETETECKRSEEGGREEERGRQRQNAKGGRREGERRREGDRERRTDNFYCLDAVFDDRSNFGASRARKMKGSRGVYE